MNIWQIVLSLCMLVLPLSIALSQTPTDTANTLPHGASASLSEPNSARVRIGPGDLLEVKVFMSGIAGASGARNWAVYVRIAVPRATLAFSSCAFM